MKRHSVITELDLLETKHHEGMALSKHTNKNAKSDRQQRKGELNQKSPVKQIPCVSKGLAGKAARPKQPKTPKTEPRKNGQNR